MKMNNNNGSDTVPSNIFINRQLKRLLGKEKRNDKKWVSQNTWNIIEERTKFKEKALNTKSDRKKQIQKSHSHRYKNKEVKNTARQCKHVIT